MASVYMNAFDLLCVESGDESDDVTFLCDRMQKKSVVETPTSPRKTRKEYVVFGEKSEELVYEAETHVNGNELSDKTENENGSSNGNGNLQTKDGNWKSVTKKVKAVPEKVTEEQPQGDDNNRSSNRNNGGKGRGRGNGQVQQADVVGSEVSKENGHENGEKPKRNGNWNNQGGRRGGDGYRGKGRGRGEYRRVDNGNVVNGSGPDAEHSTVTLEGDAAVITESSNGEDTAENKTVEAPVETAEERKRREQREQEAKERKEKQEKRKKEQEEEAKLMTLAQYEKSLLNKEPKIPLKAVATRVAPLDKDLENMKPVVKKEDYDEILIVQNEKPKGKAVLKKVASEGTLKKSGSFEKKGRKPVAVGLTELFRQAPFRQPNVVGGGRDQGGFGHRFHSNEGQSSVVRQRKDAPVSSSVIIPAEVDDYQFPVVGSVTPQLAPEPVSAPVPAPVPVPLPEPVAIPSGNGSASIPKSSGPSNSRSRSRGYQSNNGYNTHLPNVRYTPSA